MKGFITMTKKVWVSVLVGLCLAICSQAQTGNQTAVDPTKTPPSRVGYSTNDFVFGGGNLREFIIAVHDVYGVDLSEQVTVPDKYLSQVRVPKLKVSPAHDDYGQPRQISFVSFRSVLSVYNQLTDSGIKGLGKWVMPLQSGTIVFLPPGPDELDMTKKLRVFSIEAKSDAQKKVLDDALHAALDFYENEKQVSLEGQFRYHDSTGLLMAVGDESFLNLVSEVVKALKEPMTAEKPKP